MHEVLTSLLLLATAAYVIQSVFLIIGLKKANSVQTRDNYEPTVSIIIAARNEEEHIEKCISSVVNIEYPRDKLEIIIIDDRSSDKTADIVEQFSIRYSHLKLLRAKPGTGNLRGKTNAVAQGINMSKGEILMFTDADCSVPPTWIRETVRYFTWETGVVGGFTLLDAHSQFEGMQALDWIYLFGIASSTAGWNIPLTVIGNNICVRRDAYNKTGGFEQIPFSVTEDYALVQAILQRTDFKVRFPSNLKTVVRSKACKTFSQLFRQKQRWSVGGLDMIARGMLIMFLGWLMKFSLLLSFLFMTSSIPLWALAGSIIADFLLLEKVFKNIKATSYLKYFPVFEIYLFCYAIIIPFLAMFSRKVVWKERSL